MQRHLRLRRREDFAAVHRRGRSLPGTLLVLRALPNGLDVTRTGFSISKRVGKAVVRNRIKRRLREALRQLSPKYGFDLVVIARAPAAGADYHGLSRALKDLLTRARLLPNEPGTGDGGQVRRGEDV